MGIANADGSIVLSTKVDTKGLQKDLKGATKMAGKALLSIGALAGATTVAITKMAVSAYADYEQLVGGVETLFKDSAQKVKNYAEDAFYTAGISKNEYMRQVTSFSASLIKSTAGDTEKAADIANMALIDISDNVNKMGSMQESVTLAYQGFAKQQYMLLDNLKLGYGGTKTEMERLLKDAQALTGVKYDINNLADVYSAIHAIQEELGIAGTTAIEAEGTIEGSANMTKAAWQDTLTALAGGGDIDRAMNNLVYSITKYMQNIVPVIKVILMNIGILLESAVPMLMQAIVEAVIVSTPILMSAIYNMILGIFSGLVSGIKALFSGSTKEVTKELVNSTEKMTSNIGGAVTNQEELTDAVKETNKQLNKSLASFDELNTISQDAGSGAGSEGAFVGGIAAGGTGGGFSLGEPNGTGLANEINSTILSIMGVVGIGLIAIGLILCVTGNIAWGVGFIVAGAGVLGITVATLKDNAISQKTKDALSNVLIIAGIVAIILGILCCIAQKWVVGIGLIVLGALVVGSVVALNWKGIKAQMKDAFGGVLAVIGLVAIILGVLCCVAQHWAIGIGLIATGALAVGSVVAVNWDSIKTMLQGKLGKALAIVGVVAIILGILCCVSGFWGLGIGFIVAGGLAVGSVVAVNWDTILAKMKDLWARIKAWWNTSVAKYFTAEYWAQKGTNMVNGLIRRIVEGLNRLIDKLNTFGFNIPDVLGGGRVGFNISRLNVPQLATGTVVPPNKKFLSILGDNTKEHEVVSPLSTMKQAFKEAMFEMGGNGFSGRIEVPVYLGNRQIALAVREAESEMGTETVVGGFANAY